MKNSKVILGILILFSTIFFTNCTKDDTTQEKLNTNSNPLMDVGIGIKLVIKGKPYKPRNDCESGFGLCEVEFSLEPTLTTGIPISLYKPLYDINDNTYKMFIEFNETPINAESIFIGADADPFTLPSNVSEGLEFSNITILPGDYSYIVDIDNPNGYVIVNCDVTQ